MAITLKAKASLKPPHRVKTNLVWMSHQGGHRRGYQPPVYQFRADSNDHRGQGKHAGNQHQRGRNAGTERGRPQVPSPECAYKELEGISQGDAAPDNQHTGREPMEGVRTMWNVQRRVEKDLLAHEAAQRRDAPKGQ